MATLKERVRAVEALFPLTGDARLTRRCATEGCGGQPTYRFEAVGVGADYCSGCADRIAPMKPLVLDLWDEVERQRSKITALEAERDRAMKACEQIGARIGELVGYADMINGTPCAEIRWQEERDDLRRQIAALEDENRRLRAERDRARAEASAARAALIRSGSGFVDADPERAWAEYANESCPCCGGSGHKDDADDAMSDARAEGYRQGIEAAAQGCVLSGQDLAEGDWGPEGRDMAVMLERRIRALLRDGPR